MKSQLVLQLERVLLCWNLVSQSKLIQQKQLLVAESKWVLETQLLCSQLSLEIEFVELRLVDWQTI